MLPHRELNPQTADKGIMPVIAKQFRNVFFLIKPANFAKQSQTAGSRIGIHPGQSIFQLFIGNVESVT